MTNRLRLLGVLFAAATTAAACGAGSSTETAVPVSANDHLVGEFSTLSGSSVDLAQFQGTDTVLWFWAPW